VSVYLRMLRLIAPLRWWMALALLLYLLTIGAGVGLIATAAYLISRAALGAAFVDLAVFVTAVRAFAISRAALRYGERYISHLATFRILTRLRVWLYAAIEPLAPAGLEGHGSGDLLTRIAADVETLDQFYIRTVVPPIAAALVCALGFVFFRGFALQLGIAVLVFLILTGAVLPLATQRLSRRPAKAFVQTRADLNALLADEIDGLSDLLAFGRAGDYQSRSLHLGDALDAALMRVARVRGLAIALGGFFAGAAALTVLMLAIPLVHGGRIDGVFLAVLPLAAIACFEAVQPLGAAVQELERSKASAARLFELIDRPPDRPEPGRSPIPGLQKGIELRDVRFRYGPEEPLILDALNLFIRAGRCVALTGASGCGKSTLVNLLAGFRQAQAGTIRVCGNPIDAYRGDDLRALLGIASQQTYLFNGTIRDNLLLAKGDASDAEIAEACAMAQVEAVVRALPDGYDTLVGENGMKLSGGERQRFAIARVILKGAPILILDEATSNLDAASERKLLSALAPFLRGRTTLIIAHRGAALELADEVYRLDGGSAKLAATDLQVQLQRQ
jgi:ATP-binding cassette, subfamily C, bacterial CydC